MQVSVGDYVVYPSQGVGRIAALERRIVAGQYLAFAKIRVVETGGVVLVPVDKLEHVGVRPVIATEEVLEVLEVFDEPMPNHHGISWIRRSRDYEERVASGSTDRVAGVLRDLYIMKWDGPLSFGQLRLFERSREMVVQELSIALDDPPEHVERAIIERIRAANELAAA